MASIPPTAILSYRILTDGYKICHYIADSVVNCCRGKDHDGQQRPGFHWNTNTCFGWIGVGAHTSERKYDEYKAYIRKLNEVWVAEENTVLGRFKKNFLGMPTQRVVSDERLATFLSMLELKTVQDLEIDGYTLETLIGADVPVRTLVNRGARISSILMIDKRLLVDLYRANVPLDDIMEGVFDIGEGCTRRDIENLPRDTQESDLIRLELLRVYDQRVQRDRIRGLL